MIAARATTLLTLAVLVAAGAALAQDDLPIIDQWTTAGSCRAVCGHGTAMHAGAGGYLISSDVSSPAAPALLATTWFGSQVQDLALLEQAGRVLVAVALGHDGLEVVDVSDPSAPLRCSGLDGVEAWKVVAIGPRFYVAASTGGVLVVDPSDPDAPALTGHIPARPSHEPRALAGRAGFLYVATQDDRIDAYALADPDQPLPTGSTRGGNYVDLACNGALLAALTSDALEIIDVAHFDAMPLLGAWVPEDGLELAHAVLMQADRAWVVDIARGVHVVSLSDPQAPVTLALQTWPDGQAWSLGAVGDLMALGTADLGTALLAEQGGEVVELGRAADPWPASLPLVDAAGPVTVAASRHQQLVVFGGTPAGGTVATLTVPQDYEVEACGTDGDYAVAGVWRDGDYFYQRLWVVDVSDAAAPTTIHFGHGLPSGMNNHTRQVEVRDHKAWIINNGLAVRDLTDIDNMGPAWVGSYGMTRSLGPFCFVADDRVCIWDGYWDELRMLDYGTNWNLDPVETLPVATPPLCLASSGSRLYVAQATQLLVFGVAALGQPSQLLATLPLSGYPLSMEAGADGLWIAFGAGGLERWDLSDVADPRLTGRLDHSGRVDGVALGGLGAIVSAPHRGLLWVEAPLTPAPLPAVAAVQLTAYPNPFNPATVIEYTLGRPGPVSLAVFDLAGRRVATLVDGEHRAAGRHPVGYTALQSASGVYFVRLQTPDGEATEKIVLLK